MRIQHNIMAMSAYRNYTNNVSAMKKNLEKLSSGYKINRAGDDAAGLAISEKMRAQITGLETAQKNAKDGISLIQTAEGALTEVHDMLNRMVELASMSANGTYDDTTDRAQLQKELNQLRSEIDRIADSSNFNGIKLLDGSMDAGGAKQAVSITLPPESAKQFGEIGDKTITKGTGADAKPTKFGVQFDNLGIDAKAGDTLEVDVGGTKITLTLEAKKYTAKDLAAALKAEFDKDPTAAKFGAAGKQQEFTAEVVGDTSVVFTQKTAPTGADDTVEATMDVKMTFKPTGGTAMPLIDNGIQTFEAGGSSAISGNASSNIDINGTPDVAAVYQGTVAVGSTALAAGNVITIGSKSFTVVAASATNVTNDQVKVTDVASQAQLLQFIQSNASVAGFEVSKSSDGTKLVFTSTTPGTAANSAAPSLTVSVKASASGSAVAGYSVTVGSTATTQGANAVTGTKFANASGLSKDAIKAAADATASIADGSVTIELNATSKKLELKIGDKVIGTASTAVASTASASSATYTFATASGTTLGTVTLSGSVASGDITKALNTGLSYTAKTGGGGENTVASSKLPDGGINFAAAGSTTITASVAGTFKNAILALGSATGKVTVGEVEIDLNSVASTVGNGSTTVQTVANALLAAAKKGANDWNAAHASASYTYDNVRISTTAAGASSDIIAQNAGDGWYILMDKKAKDGGGSGAGVSGSYNAATVAIDQGSAVQADKRASTTIDLGKIFGDDIGDGSELRVGNSTTSDTYKFVWGDEFKHDGDHTITLKKDATAAERINYAAKAMTNMKSAAFSIGNEETTGKLTFDEKAGNETFATELKDFKSFQGLFSATKIGAKDDKKGLTLQIGDTAEDFNQLKVSIGNTHCSALGIDESQIRIDNQDDAATAIDRIKAAINTVSDIRGTLGATQNRLDHTINNLSVMTENIQDAESTIRDVDVAEEMMAYTKNNILIQSAQAMLAQANQVPQGVLQLLQ